MAHIKQRGSKWRAQVCIHGIRSSRSFGTEYEAIRWAMHQESFAFDHGRPVNVPMDDAEAQVDPRTLADLIDWFIQERVKQWRRTPTAQHREVARLNRLRQDPIAHLLVKKLTAADAAAFRSRRMRNAALSTVNKELVVFGQIIDAAMKENGLDLAENPFAPGIVMRPRFRNERDRVLDVDERALLYAALLDSSNPLLSPAVRLSAETGLRLSELLGLTWRDVNLGERLLKVRRVFDQVTQQMIEGTKNGDSREVPLTTEAVIALQSVPRTEARVFPVTHNALQTGLKRALRRAGIVDFRWHDLRHCAITMLAQFILVPMDMMEVAGFRTLQQVLRYYKAKNARALVPLLP